MKNYQKPELETYLNSKDDILTGSPDQEMGDGLTVGGNNGMGSNNNPIEW